MTIAIIHGPNLNLLGSRDPAKYGTITMDTINDHLVVQAESVQPQHELTLLFYQSNHEGSLIDFLQTDEVRASDGAIINPGALIRYAYSFRQALIDYQKPFIEVHMSDIAKTGVNNGINVLDDVPNRINQITGKREHSYYEGLEQLITQISSSYDTSR